MQTIFTRFSLSCSLWMCALNELRVSISISVALLFTSLEYLDMRHVIHSDGRRWDSAGSGGMWIWSRFTYFSLLSFIRPKAIILRIKGELLAVCAIGDGIPIWKFSRRIFQIEKNQNKRHISLSYTHSLSHSTFSALLLHAATHSAFVFVFHFDLSYIFAFHFSAPMTRPNFVNHTQWSNAE